MAGFVDYEAVAGTYARVRALGSDQLGAWGSVAGRFVSGCEVAVDLGAGTGVFSAALHRWGARRVIAVEPVAAMNAEARSAPAVLGVRAVGERLPLRDGSAGVVWISAALHHFTDRWAAVRECARIVDRGGHVLIRGFIPGHTRLAWLELFPGADRAVARFPSVEAIDDLFERVGWSRVHDCEVVEHTMTSALRVGFTEQMRHADSILTALTDDEIATGLASLRAEPDRVEPAALSLLVYRKGPRRQVRVG